MAPRQHRVQHPPPRRMPDRSPSARAVVRSATCHTVARELAPSCGADPTLVVLMTMYFPAICRKSSATWTLATAIVVFVAWLIAQQLFGGLPDAIYFTLPASILVFLAVPLFDSRRIERR